MLLVRLGDEGKKIANVVHHSFREREGRREGGEGGEGGREGGREWREGKVKGATCITNHNKHIINHRNWKTQHY